MLKYFWIICRVVWAVQLQATWWHCTAAALGRTGLAAANRPRGQRPGYVYHPPIVPEELSTGRHRPRSRRCQWFRHWGSKPRRKHWHPGHHSPDWSTARPALQLERGARALVINDLTGKLIKGSAAIPYVKPRLGNGGHLAKCPKIGN